MNAAGMPLAAPGRAYSFDARLISMLKGSSHTSRMKSPGSVTGRLWACMSRKYCRARKGEGQEGGSGLRG